MDEAFLELDDNDELNVQQVTMDDPNNHLTRQDQLFHW